MASHAQKSKKDQKHAFDHQLLQARHVIGEKIESLLSPVTFQVALKTYSGYLSSELPISVWNKLFQRDREVKSEPDQEESDQGPQSEEITENDGRRKPPEGKEDQNPLEDLSLQEVIMISQTLPPLKTKLNLEEKQALGRLQEFLGDVHIEHLIQDKEASELKEKRYQSLEEGISAIITLFDANSEGAVEKHDQKTSGNNADISSLFTDEILKKLDTKLNSNEESVYTDKEREELRKVIEEARSQKMTASITRDSLSTLGGLVHSAIQMAMTCGHCHRMPKDPRTLPCLHVCCTACLKANFTDNSNAGSSVDKQTITCPVCHTRISMPSVSHVEQLPTGFVTEALMKLEELRTIGKTNPECIQCISPPTHLCLLCSHLYCTDHTAACYKHGDMADVEQRPSHGDMIVPFSTLTSPDHVASLLYQFCPQHRQRLSHFCPGCRVPLCSHMLCVDWHSKHVDSSPGLRPIDEVMTEEHQKLATIQNLLCKKAEGIRTKIDQVEKNQITVADVQENIRHSIEKYFADFEEKLAKHKVAFLSDLDKSAAQCFQNDESIHARLQTWAEKTEKLDTAFRHYFDNRPTTTSSDTSPTSTGASVPELASLRFQILQQLSDSCTGALVASTKRLSYPETRLRELQHVVGTLQSNITTASGSRGWEGLIKFTSTLSPSSVGTPQHFVIDSLKKIAYVVKSGGLVASGQVLSYDLKQMDNREPRVVCDAGPRSFETVTMDSYGRRLFVAEQPHNSLELPTMRFKKSIQVRVFEFNNIGAFGLVRTASLEHLNTFSKAIIKYCGDRFYVCDGVCVCEYDISDNEFKLMRKFNFHNMLDIADFAVEPGRDFLYVVDRKKHSLLIFSCQHQVVKSIGEQGVTPGKFDQPSGITIDQFGHVFVADTGNFRVQVFDVDGKFLRFIQFPQPVKEVAQSPGTLREQKSGAVSSVAKVTLQTAEDCLYMFDSRADQLWRYRYM